MRTYGCLYYAPDRVPGASSSVPLTGGGTGSWTVPSDTWPDTEYTVTKAPGGRFECDCPGFRYGARADGECKHTDRVRGWLAEDPLAAAAAAALSWLQ